MKHSDSIANLSAALVKVCGELRPVAKDRINPHFKNKYATLDAITEAVRPVLAKHGLAVVQGTTAPDSDQGHLTGFAVETMLVHASGEWMSNAVFMPIDKASAQGAGSAISYGRRYGLSALLGLTADEDDDGESATNHAPQRVQSRPAAATPPKATTVPPRQATGSSGSADAFVMPFGKTKGTPLGNMDLGDLANAVQWAKDKGKFAEFVAAGESVLARAAKDVGYDLPPEPEGFYEDHNDNLPFS